MRNWKPCGAKIPMRKKTTCSFCWCPLLVREDGKGVAVQRKKFIKSCVAYCCFKKVAIPPKCNFEATPFCNGCQKLIRRLFECESRGHCRDVDAALAEELFKKIENKVALGRAVQHAAQLRNDEGVETVVLDEEERWTSLRDRILEGYLARRPNAILEIQKKMMKFGARDQAPQHTSGTNISGVVQNVNSPAATPTGMTSTQNSPRGGEGARAVPFPSASLVTPPGTNDTTGQGQRLSTSVADGTAGRPKTKLVAVVEGRLSAASRAVGPVAGRVSAASRRMGAASGRLLAPPRAEGPVAGRISESNRVVDVATGGLLISSRLVEGTTGRLVISSRVEGTLDEQGLYREPSEQVTGAGAAPDRSQTVGVEPMPPGPYVGARGHNILATGISSPVRVRNTTQRVGVTVKNIRSYVTMRTGGGSYQNNSRRQQRFAPYPPVETTVPATTAGSELVNMNRGDVGATLPLRQSSPSSSSSSSRAGNQGGTKDHLNPALVLHRLPSSSLPNGSKVFVKKTIFIEKMKKYVPKMPGTEYKLAIFPRCETGPSTFIREADQQQVWKCPVCFKEETYNFSRNMICCDACEDWFHWSCVGIRAKPATDKPWFCKRCLCEISDDPLRDFPTLFK